MAVRITIGQADLPNLRFSGYGCYVRNRLLWSTLYYVHVCTMYYATTFLLRYNHSCVTALHVTLSETFDADTLPPSVPQIEREGAMYILHVLYIPYIRRKCYNKCTIRVIRADLGSRQLKKMFRQRMHAHAAPGVYPGEAPP